MLIFLDGDKLKLNLETQLFLHSGSSPTATAGFLSPSKRINSDTRLSELEKNLKMIAPISLSPQRKEFSPLAASGGISLSPTKLSPTEQLPNLGSSPRSPLTTKGSPEKVPLVRSNSNEPKTPSTLRNSSDEQIESPENQPNKPKTPRGEDKLDEEIRNLPSIQEERDSPKESKSDSDSSKSDNIKSEPVLRTPTPITPEFAETYAYLV